MKTFFFILHMPDLQRKYNIVLDVQWNHAVLLKMYIYMKAVFFIFEKEM